ncbi:MAG: hypothetical protein AAF228_11930 [Pseudomonadota bacterium]
MPAILNDILRGGLLSIILLYLSACSGTTKSFNLLSDDKDKSVNTSKENSIEQAQNNPESRAIQVAWTSARAVKCGFYFDNNKLRQDFILHEQNQGVAGNTLKKIQLTYDFTYRSISLKIKDDKAYCAQKTIEKIRSDLNRHMVGDYTPSPKSTQAKG